MALKLLHDLKFFSRVTAKFEPSAFLFSHFLSVTLCLSHFLGLPHSFLFISHFNSPCSLLDLPLSFPLVSFATVAHRQTIPHRQANKPYGLFFELCSRERFFLSSLYCCLLCLSLLKPSLCPPLTYALCFFSLHENCLPAFLGLFSSLICLPPPPPPTPPLFLSSFFTFKSIFFFL